MKSQRIFDNGSIRFLSSCLNEQEKEVKNEQDLNDLMGENSRLQTELTATQKKLFKAKETIRIVRTGSKEKEKVSLLQETLKALEKQHAAVVAELSSTQGDLMEYGMQILNAADLVLNVWDLGVFFGPLMF